MSGTRQIAILSHCCFINEDCNKQYSTPRKLRDHLQDIHKFVFPVRLASTRRYNSKEYLFLKVRPDGDVVLVNERFACPCCIDHFGDLNDLATHFGDIHNEYQPQQQERNHDIPDSMSSTNERNSDVTPSSSTPVSEENIQDAALPSHQGETSRKRTHDEALSMNGIEFLPPDCDRLLIGQFDASQAFFDYQSSLKNEKWKLSLEKNVHLALATTSVLLLTPNIHCSGLQDYFTIEQWAATNSRLHDLYGIKNKPMPLDTIRDMLGVIDELKTKAINREEADSKLKKLTLSEHEHKFAKAVGGLVLKLMALPMDEDANETELCTRFIDPFLSGLFDDPDQGVYLRWTNDATLEAKSYPDCTTTRPDLCITKCCGVKWTSSLGYGEAKPAARENDKYVLCKDLWKVAVFCKDALDSQLIDGVLGIQIIGRTIRFYLLMLPARRLYVMLELATIKIPDSLQNLPALVIELPNVLKVLDVFHRICVPSNDPAILKSRYASTLSTQKFHQLFSTSKNCKKPCHLNMRHN
ncbi:hypothetical protein DM01DRAFT_1340968 [Hesseltinella vesiculosa]|uniref:C2H2-type domain-containing protein n=1 Tax=Hesseltinella vesiculosa TaxID=101127 RepID=A0A1X2G3K4_9FUNG|nr:hypothetical protein DM01DRAFT_1340968 [Hesseltinella vesiculosa]